MTDAVQFSSRNGRCYVEDLRRRRPIGVNEEQMRAEAGVVFRNHYPEFVPLRRVEWQILGWRLPKIDIVVIDDIAIQPVNLESHEVGLRPTDETTRAVVACDQRKANFTAGKLARRNTPISIVLDDDAVARRRVRHYAVAGFAVRVEI